MRVVFTRRNLSGVFYLPGIEFQVERMSWNLQGGPAKAEILVRGPVNLLGAAVQLIRCGATISDETGAPAWWGFVNGVDLCLDGKRVLSISLDDLYNRVAVRYRDERISPEVNVGWQFQTAWLQDYGSVLEWGQKEGIFVQVPATPTEAGSLAAAMLEKHKRPVLRPVTTRGASPAGFARLRLRGWWETLNWLYYSDSRGYAGFNGGGSIQNWGNVAASTLLAQSFSVPAAWTASTLWVKIGKYGSPADNLTGYLRPDDEGVPGWPPLASSGVVAGPTLSGDLSWVRFDFTTPYGLAASTTYWVCVDRSGGLDAANYYRLSLDDGLAYAGGTMLMWNGAWVARVPDSDMVFQLTGTAQTTDQIKGIADPAGAGQFLKGVWIVDGSGISGRLYRDGREKAGDEIQALLDQGDSTGRRLMATVTPERYLVVRLVPAAPAGGVNLAELVLLPSGELRNREGGRLPGSFNPVGKWARVKGIDQPGGDRNAPGCVLVSKAEWINGRSGIEWE